MLKPLVRCAAVLVFAPATTAIAIGCKCVKGPEDTCWPTRTEWTALNRSVSGKLIANVQPAAPCYPGPFQDDAACAYVASQWTNEAYQASTAIGLSYPTESCPIVDVKANESPKGNCTIGDQPVYTIDATEPEDVARGVTFARKHNIRLVIRDTGHDILRRSTGYGSLQIWIKHLRKGVTYQQKYVSIDGCSKSAWTGSAFKISGGYIWSDILGEAASRKVVVVGGGTPSVGCLGGWMQGGGHGPAVHDYGLGADQVLEAQVVLADGRTVTANQCQQSDLFFAIRGGGGSTYGIVVSTTVKAHPTVRVAAQQLSFAPLKPANTPDFMKAIEIVYNSYPALSDKGYSGYGSWSIASPTPLVYNYNYTIGGETAANFTTGFTHTIAAFGKSSLEAQAIFAPVAAKLSSFAKSLFINITYSSFPAYSDYYTALSGIEQPVGISPVLGSRLLDRNALTSPKLGETLKTIAGTTEQFTSNNVVFVGGGQVSKDASDPFSGVNPAWRSSYVHNIVARGLPPGADKATKEAVYKDITNVKVQAMKNLAPNTGAYMNEGDRFDPEYLKDFYGQHQSRLSAIKAKYDPLGVFYCPTCIGSDRWSIDTSGKLCSRRRK